MRERNRRKSSNGFLSSITSLFTRKGRRRDRDRNSSTQTGSTSSSSYSVSEGSTSNGDANIGRREDKQHEGCLSIIIKILKIALLLLLIYMVYGIIKVCTLVSKGEDIVDAIWTVVDAFKKIFSWFL